MRLLACAVVMFEKAVMRETKALAGVPGDDWTTAMRLIDCCEVSAAAEDIAGAAKKKSARAAVANVRMLLIITHYDACGRVSLPSKLNILLFLFKLSCHILHDILSLKRLHEFSLITTFSFAH